MGHKDISAEGPSNPPYPTTTVDVKKINGRHGKRFSPCDRCIYKNVLKNKKLMYNNTHAIYMRWKSFSPNIMSGQHQACSEYIGICTDFTEVPVTYKQIVVK